MKADIMNKHTLLVCMQLLRPMKLHCLVVQLIFRTTIKAKSNEQTAEIIDHIYRWMMTTPKE